AEVVARGVAAERQRLRDAEVEDLDLVGPEHADVARLQVAVQQRTQVASVDRRLEAVGRLEEMTQLNRDVDGTAGRQRAGRENLGEILAVDVLHRDIEVAPLGAVFVDHRNVLANPAELLLKLRAPALCREHLLRVAIGCGRDQLQRNTAAVAAVGGDEDHGHAAAADLVADLVRSDAYPLEDRRHHRPRCGRGTIADGARTSCRSANQLSPPNLSGPPPLGSPRASRLRSSKMFPVKCGSAPSSMMNERWMRSEVPFRMNTLCAIRGDAERMVRATPGLS